MLFPLFGVIERFYEFEHVYRFLHKPAPNPYHTLAMWFITIPNVISLVLWTTSEDPGYSLVDKNLDQRQHMNLHESDEFYTKALFPYLSTTFF